MAGANTSFIGGLQTTPVANPASVPGRRLIVALMGVACLSALLVFGSRLLQDPQRFPVAFIDVLGTMDYADRDALTKTIGTYTQQGFYALNIDRLRHSIEQRQWVASARVSRVWPDRISIEVEEHEPAARWNDDHLISKQLVLFKPHQLDKQRADYQQWKEVFRPLPQVLGAQGRHAELLDVYRNLDQQLARFDLSLKLLEEDERLSQTLVLSNDVHVLIGREQRELRLNRFVDVYERIAADATEGPLSFDMRYSNGFALGLADHLNDY